MFGNGSERKLLTLLMGFFIVFSLLHESGASHVRDQNGIALGTCHSLDGGVGTADARIVSNHASLVMGTLKSTRIKNSWPGFLPC
jgi:hypothetical protein